MAYTEALPSSFKFNATETVDTVFSKILVNNLFKDNTFKPGVTFTNKYNDAADRFTQDVWERPRRRSRPRRARAGWI